MSALDQKDDVTTTLETADRIPIYRSTLDVWQLIALEQLRGPFAQGFPSAGAQTLIYDFDDFLIAGDGLKGFQESTSGTAASIGVTNNTVGNRIGLVSASTGTDTTGRAALTSGGGAIVLGSGRFRFRWDVQVPTASDGTDTFSAKFGLGDAVSGTFVDGVYFRYTHSENSGNWTCVTISNSTETSTDSGAAMSAGSWHVLECEINAAASSVTFYVDGTASSGGAHTTNIPSGATRRTGIIGGIFKSAGTTSRSAYADLCAWTLEPTTPR